MAKRERQEKAPEKALFRINELIRVPEVRLIGDEFETVSEVAGHEVETGIYSTGLLLDWAQKAGLDLVEISSPNAHPPVVKIIDYQKFLYNKKKKDRELKAKLSKPSSKKSVLVRIQMIMTLNLK